MIWNERCGLAVENPLSWDPTRPVEEASVADIPVPDVKAIYPMIRMITSNKLTRNYTFYPPESLTGREKGGKVTGYRSFVKPYGKPVIREHRVSDGPGREADVPMGRLFYAGFRKRRDADGPLLPAPFPFIPGTAEGDGYMVGVAAIVDPLAIRKVLGRAYHTVSVGCNVERVIESISQIDIAKAYRTGGEMPSYSRGQVYTIDGKPKLSYYIMGEVEGRELSFVNTPSDTHAGVLDTDIGEGSLRLLLGEKKSGSKEVAFYDAVSKRHVKIDEIDEYAFDESFGFVDSVGTRDMWWVDTGNIAESLGDTAYFQEYYRPGVAGKGSVGELLDIVAEEAEWESPTVKRILKRFRDVGENETVDLRRRSWGLVNRPGDGAKPDIRTRVETKLDEALESCKKKS